VVTLTLNLSEAVTVAGGTPTLTLNNGGTATYAGGSGTGALTFSYTVAAGQSTSDLTVTGVSLNGATVKDGAGNAANLGGVATNPTGTLQVDTSAHLTHVGNKHFLANSAGVGPAISSAGVAITDTQMGAWTFIAAVQVGSGYQVALKATGADQYTVWNTDGNGNVISNALGGAVSGSSSALQGIEASFQQDLNGDGTIGLVTTRVESLGATALDQAANYYLLNPVGGGTGPQLKSGGSVITVDQLGGWTLIGAEKTTSGYEVALKSGNQYTVWNTDNNGNVISNAVGGAVSGSSSALQGIEASFHQDLNGDGIILLSGSGSIVGANSLVIGSGASVELTGAYSGSVTFAGATGTLVIDNSASFHGTIGGQLVKGDVIDLVDITAGAGATLGYTGNNSPGTLTVSDGNHSVSIALSGNYSLGNFIASSDGHGGTSVVDPPLPGQYASVTPEDSNDDPVNSFAAVDALAELDQRLALWSQHMASAFASSGWDGARTSMGGSSQFGDHLLPQLAQAVTDQQRPGMTA